MDAIASAVLGDLMGRSISFAIDRYCHRRDEGTVQEKLKRLRRVLLRIQITVEEAERRRVTNQAMLQQLHLMRQGMYRGHYLLNAVVCQDKSQVREVSPHRHSSLALSEFNPAKRICLLPARTTTTAPVTAPYTGREAEAALQQVLVGLERMASDMKELVLFLSSYPPRVREPYSRHLWLQNRMFGRDAEYERIIRFLLEPEHAGARDLPVLPVIGPARVGKSTLVEHVWRDERVRKHFSLVVFLGESDIVGEDLQLTPLGDRGVIKYRSEDLASTTGSSLVVIELVGSVDESAWRRALSTLKSEGTAPVSKIVVTSRSEMVSSFGTMKALELKPLSREAYWYFFKIIAFGSTADAEEQLGLASVCMEIADVLRGAFISANTIGGLLRNNLCAGFWHKVLKCLKDQASTHLRLFGEDAVDRFAKDQPIYLWRLFESDSVLIVYNCYEVCSVQQLDLPKITVRDVQTGSTTPREKFNALACTSYIPPYSSYLLRCGVQTSRHSSIYRPRTSKSRSGRRDSL